MPKKVDHETRRRQITDAVCRITLRGGLGAATIRQVAAEAGVSVRLVQYYFGTKAGLLDITQEHVGQRSIERLMRWIKATDGSPRQVLGAFLKSFIPVDEESRMAGLMYIALYNESVLSANSDGTQPETRKVEAEMMRSTITEQLELGPLAPGVNVRIETELLAALTTGIGQYVLDATITAQEAYDTIDHHLDRLFGLPQA